MRILSLIPRPGQLLKLLRSPSCSAQFHRIPAVFVQGAGVALLSGDFFLDFGEFRHCVGWACGLSVERVELCEIYSMWGGSRRGESRRANALAGPPRLLQFRNAVCINFDLAPFGLCLSAGI